MKDGIALILLADGFEETEAVVPADVLRRAGKKVITAGISGKIVTGAHGIPVIADCAWEEIKNEKIDCLILPGGMPGTKNLDLSPVTNEAIASTLKNDGRLAAICAAPSVYGKRNLLSGKKATCYPSFGRFLIGAGYVNAPVVTDGNVTTSQGPGTAFDFAFALAALLVSPEAAEKVKSDMLADRNR